MTANHTHTCSCVFDTHIMIFRACDAGDRMQLRPGKKLRNNKRTGFKPKLPDVVLARVFQFATSRNLQKDFSTYKSVCAKWHRCSLHPLVMQFLRPSLSRLKDRHCESLASLKGLHFLHLQRCYITNRGLQKYAYTPTGEINRRSAKCVCVFSPLQKTNGHMHTIRTIYIGRRK